MPRSGCRVCVAAVAMVFCVSSIEPLSITTISYVKPSVARSYRLASAPRSMAARFCVQTTMEMSGADMNCPPLVLKQGQPHETAAKEKGNHRHGDHSRFESRVEQAKHNQSNRQRVRRIAGAPPSADTGHQARGGD